jgi:hypothetical protein
MLPSPSPSPRAPLEPAGPLARRLERPLDALRAALEELTRAHPVTADVADAALAEVARLRADVELLGDWLDPVEPCPVHASTDEVARTARSLLPAALRERVWIAHETTDAALHLDATRASSVLAMLLEDSLRAGSERALLVLRRRAAHAEFAVVDRAPRTSFDLVRASRSAHDARMARRGLLLPLALRDARRLGGDLTFERTELGETIARLHVPAGTAPEGRKS